MRNTVKTYLHSDRSLIVRHHRELNRRIKKIIRTTDGNRPSWILEGRCLRLLSHFRCRSSALIRAVSKKCLSPSSTQCKKNGKNGFHFANITFTAKNNYFRFLINYYCHYPLVSCREQHRLLVKSDMSPLNYALTTQPRCLYLVQRITQLRLLLKSFIFPWFQRKRNKHQCKFSSNNHPQFTKQNRSVI